MLNSLFYRRSTRAHANCVENIPVYAALALIAAVVVLDTSWLDRSAIAVIIGRVGKTLTRMALPERNVTVAIRFTFLFVQLTAMFLMAGIIALAGLA